ncbi:MAG: riboflavin synthase [Litorilinea sp.]
MFTGIVEEIGTVSQLQPSGDGYSLTLRARTVLEGTRLGDSIAVNGVCLTVIRLLSDGFVAGLSPETRKRTNLLRLHQGDGVNLERSLTPSSRMGGHFVQGHVDGTGVITAFRADGDALWMTIQAPDTLMRYIVAKGFIALDGVSLTVVDVFESGFTVTLVAYTQQQIMLSRQKIGYQVNLEVDILGKYVEKLLDARFDHMQKQGLSLDFLAEHGFQ